MKRVQTGASSTKPARHPDYYVVVPAELLEQENTIIDELISFAFDTLGTWRLNVRVHDRAVPKAPVEGEAQQMR